MMSSASDEYSYEVYFLEDLTFTHFVMEAIKQYDSVDINRDGELSAEEIFQYVEPETVSFSEELEIGQHPILSDGCTGEVGLLIKFVFDTNLNIKAGLVVDGENTLTVSPSFSGSPVPLMRFRSRQRWMMGPIAGVYSYHGMMAIPQLPE